MEDKNEVIVLTGSKLYTPEEAVDLFSEHISNKNMPILIDHICVPELAESVISFTEQNGVLFLNIGTGEFISVTKNDNVD
jgi:hypothetical protein